MSCGAETVAENLYDALQETTSGTVPDLVALDNASLTTEVLNGTGTFDILMRAFKNHLQEEFNGGRITGNQYTEAYVALTTAAMSNAVQFIMARDKSYWASALLKTQTDNEKGKLAGLKMQLAILDQQYCLAKEQVEAKRAETLDTRTDGTTAIAGSIGKQKELYSQQITSYENDGKYKVAKMYTDAFVTQKTLDDGTQVPTEFTMPSINTVLEDVRDNIGITP